MNTVKEILLKALSWATPLWGAIAHAAVTLWQRAVSLWSDIRDRHERLMEEDPRYPVALATGGTAVIRVVIDNPAVARAIGVLLADLLGVRDTPVRPSMGAPPWRPSPTWSPPHRSTPLWDRDDWDEEEQ